MARARSSIGFFGLFGRSGDLRQLDTALRAADVHPALMPEGVKLAIVNLMKDEAGGRFPPEAAYPPVGDLVGYCVSGAPNFEAVAGAGRRDRVESRLDLALEEGDTLDARLVLLLLHAKLIQPSVVDAYGLRVEGDGESSGVRE